MDGRFMFLRAAICNSLINVCSQIKFAKTFAWPPNGAASCIAKYEKVILVLKHRNEWDSTQTKYDKL